MTSEQSNKGRIVISPEIFDNLPTTKEKAQYQSEEEHNSVTEESPTHIEAPPSNSSPYTIHKPKKHNRNALFNGQNAFAMYDNILKAYDPLASNIVNKRKQDYTEVFDELLAKYKTFGKLEQFIVYNPEIKLAYYAMSDGFMYAKTKERSRNSGLTTNTAPYVPKSTKSTSNTTNPLNDLFNLI